MVKAGPLHLFQKKDIQMKKYVRTVPDYPIPGIQFRDITPLLQDNALFSRVVDEMTEPWESVKIDAILSIEARGFIMARVRSVTRSSRAPHPRSKESCPSVIQI